MIGDTVVSEGIEFEIIWAGGEGLVADRDTKNLGPWTAPPRLYNKTGNHTKKSKAEAKEEAKIIDILEDEGD